MPNLFASTLPPFFLIIHFLIVLIRKNQSQGSIQRLPNTDQITAN